MVRKCIKWLPKTHMTGGYPELPRKVSKALHYGQKLSHGGYIGRRPQKWANVAQILARGVPNGGN